MTSLEDCQQMSELITQACSAGARLALACELCGLSERTLQRWRSRATGAVLGGDQRPHAHRPSPSHALSEAERAELLHVANEPRFADLPPARIVPLLADEGRYLASESSFSGAAPGWAKRPPQPCQGAKSATATDHAHRNSTGPGLVLGHDLPASHCGWALVLPVPDRGPVQPQGGGLGGTRRR